MLVLKISEILEGLIASLVFLLIYIPASVLINRSTKRSNERTRKSNAKVIGQLKRNQETTKQAIRSYDNLAAKIHRQNQLKDTEKWNIRLLRQDVKHLAKEVAADYINDYYKTQGIITRVKADELGDKGNEE